ncbi:fasciclin domain-containing protein [Chitinophaga solisilvae]|uniref:fasciclin domain-containing protein n=1 Tax=Chitinophaga solisilvae TaxID=1233460 RepID=UPI00136EFA6C|nr:fasciclin domain-containing protein [Chitinophaga solisilvae]
MMREYNKYLLCALVCVMAGCIKKEAMQTAPDSTAASLRSLMKSNFSFSMFYEVMMQTGTDSLLDNNAAGYTLMVPDNGAFARSGISRDSLRKIPAADLRRMVLYHILPGKTGSAAIPQAIGFSWNTLSNDRLFTSTTSADTNLYVNGITVIRKNIQAANGIIHALNNPLTVPAASVQDLLVQQGTYRCLIAGLKKFGLWDGLKTKKPVVIIAPTDEAFALHNWNADAVEQMDPAAFRKLVFGAYIISPAFFFLQDLKMAPVAGPFLQEESLYLVRNVVSVTEAEFKVVPTNYRDPEYSMRDIFFGKWFPVPFSRPGALAVNGIVHQVDQLPVIPDSTRIK